MPRKVDENLKNIKALVKKYKDTLVLDGHEVVILRGWVDDDTPGWEDYCWAYEEFGMMGHQRWSSCVMDFIPLKDVLAEKDYARLMNSFDLNRNPKNLKRNKKVKHA